MIQDQSSIGVTGKKIQPDENLPTPIIKEKLKSDEPAELNFESDTSDLAPYAPVVIKAKPPQPIKDQENEATQNRPKFSSSYSPPQIKTVEKRESRPVQATKTSPVSFKPEPIVEPKQDIQSKPAVASPGPQTLIEPKKNLSSMTPAYTAAPSKISDFKKNADRQAKEQRAVGGVIQWIGYALITGLLMVTFAAAFGGYTLWKMVQAQSVTVAQLDSRYSSEITALQQSNQKLQEQLQQAQAKQQDQITQLTNKINDDETALRTTRQQIDRDFSTLRTKEIADLKTRLHKLESRP